MENSSRKEPLTLDEILASKNNTNKLSVSLGGKTKAKFLSKHQREKIKLEQKLKAEKEEETKKSQNDRIANSTSKQLPTIPFPKGPAAQTTLPKIPIRQVGPKDRDGKDKSNNPRKRKFNFQWDLTEDTSVGYQPLIDFQVAKRVQPEYTSFHNKSKSNDNFKEYHWSTKPLSEMKDRDWRIMREDYDISSKGGKVTNPLRSWTESSISPMIIEQLNKLGYQEPTPIQRAAIPMGLTGRDIIGIAETGSGKTLAFLIPILNYIMKLPPLQAHEGPYVLIMVPTRELALQIEKQFQKFTSLRFSVASLIGGHSYDDNIRRLAVGVEVVIATPGRLVDCLEKQIIGLDMCYFLAMDEADRMIDMGFEKEVNTVLENLPAGESNPYYFGKDGKPKRTTMMFTATMPPAVEKLTSKFLIHPGIVMIGEVGGAVDSVRQEAIQTSDDQNKKLSILERILKSRGFKPPIIIFANYKNSCETIADFLFERGFNPVTMHGSKTQEQREAAISQMKSGESDILIATDVAGRGIDIPNVSVVINYQMTRNIEDYTHRIGRTGRAGKSGTAITLWNPTDDKDVLYDLRQMITKSPISKCPDDLRRHEFAQRKVMRAVDT